MNLLSAFSHITLVDDKKEEVQHIIDIFQNNNIPFSYYEYNGSQTSLPSVTSSSVRLLFMDLYLKEGVDKLLPDVVSNIFMTVLSNIVAENTPYILIVWSKHVKDENDNKQLDPSFSSLKTRLKSDMSLAPLTVIPLDKKEIFLNDDGELDFNNAYNDLEEAIKNALTNDKIAKTLLHWNHLVGSSTGITLKDIRDLLVSKQFDADYFERLMFEFARAYLGKHAKVKEEKYKSALIFITDMFKDNLEEVIHNIEETNTLDFKKKNDNPPTLNDFALINYKTLISENSVIRPMPGCVYKKTKEDFDFYHKGFYSDIFNMRKKTEELQEGGLSKSKAGRDTKTYFKTIFSSFECITVNLTPVCDYAQGKFVYHKYCQGIILPLEFEGKEYFKEKIDFIYKTPVFLYKEKQVQLLLDFRLITDDLCDTPKSEDFLFRFRESIVVDMQYKLSNHMGRPGIVFMDNFFL